MFRAASLCITLSSYDVPLCTPPCHTTRPLHNPKGYPHRPATNLVEVKVAINLHYLGIGIAHRYEPFIFHAISGPHVIGSQFEMIKVTAQESQLFQVGE